MSTAACPGCGRPTPLGRTACLYCGAPLPEEVAAARRAPTPAAVPEDLDRLVAAALRGGGRVHVQRLREAMQQARTSPPSDDAAAPQPSPAPPPRVDPGPLRVLDAADLLPLEEPAPPPVLDLAAALDEVARQGSAARRQWQAGRHEQARATLEALQARLPALVAALPPPLPPVELPPVRRPWLLVVEGPGDAGRDRDLAQALGVDLPTARQLALSRHPRVALRADQPAPLFDRAAALARAGIQAAVGSRESLLELPAAVLLVGLDPPEAGPWAATWRVDPWPHWTSPEAPDPATLRSQARPVPALRPTLAVPGEVLLVRQAEGRDLGRTTHKRHQPAHTVGEQRIPVLDLHGPGALVRLVPGLTDLSGWPGADTLAALLAFRRLVESLPTLLPPLRVEGARACAPTRDLALTAEGPGRDRRVHTLSGWPAWEEHTRLCRLLRGVDDQSGSPGPGGQDDPG